MKRATARMATMAVLAIGALAATASPAAAGPRPTPNGKCGAANMMNEHAAPHMVEAMTFHTAPQGDAGMFHAVAVSSCRP